MRDTSQDSSTTLFHLFARFFLYGMQGWSTGHAKRAWHGSPRGNSIEVPANVAGHHVGSLGGGHVDGNNRRPSKRDGSSGGAADAAPCLVAVVEVNP